MSHGNRRLPHAPEVTGTKCMFLNEMKLPTLPSGVGGGVSAAWHHSQPPAEYRLVQRDLGYLLPQAQVMRKVREGGERFLS